MKFKRNIFKFIALFSFGFFGYMLIELLWRQYTFILMGVCGGLAIVILDKINDKWSWDFDFLLQGVLGSLLITFFEFIIGELSLHGILKQMWDYSNVPLNYKGIICVPFSILWIFMAMFAIVLADAINYYIFKEGDTPYYKIFGKVVYKFKK